MTDTEPQTAGGKVLWHFTIWSGDLAGTASSSDKAMSPTCTSMTLMASTRALLRQVLRC